MDEQNKMQDMIRTSLESIRAMVDANTVVGTPIETPAGTTIIPISKISVGYASAGLDYDGKQAKPPKNFAGGGGTGLTILPICFLAVNSEGGVEVLSVPDDKAPDSMSTISAIIEKVPEIAEKIKGFFAKKKEKKAAAEVAEPTAEESAD